MIECEAAQRTIRIELLQSIEPQRNIFDMCLYPAFQPDCCPGITQDEYVQDDSHKADSLVEGSDTAG